MLICRASLGDSPAGCGSSPVPRSPWFSSVVPGCPSVSNPPMLLIPDEPKQQMRKCLGAFRSTQNFLSKQIEGGEKEAKKTFTKKKKKNQANDALFYLQFTPMSGIKTANGAMWPFCSL